MSTYSPDYRPIRLDLPSTDQWRLHHVLCDRIEAGRRSRAADPPPDPVFRALEKIEAGDLAFTPEELGGIRGALRRYLRTRRLTRDEEACIRRLLDRTSVTASRHSPRERGPAMGG